MSVISLLYVAITPLLARRYSAKSRYYAWLIIVVGLVIPFRPQLSNSVVEIVTTETATPAIYVGNGTTAINPIQNAGFTSTSFSVSWWQIALIIWLVGVVVFLAYQAVMHYRFIKTSKRWSEVITNKRDLALLEGLKSEMGLSNQIDFLQCDSVGSPMLVGVFKPRLLLPKGDFRRDELYFILKHELVHYKRKDLWYKCLVMAATAIHWFNPIVYLITRAIDVLCEMSCDDEVIGNTGTDMRLHYSEAIIGVVKYQTRLKTAFSTNFYGGKNGMKKRIFSIMDTGKKRVGVALLCTVLLLTIGVGAAFATSSHSNAISVDTSNVEEIKELLSGLDEYSALGELNVTGAINAGKGLGYSMNNGEIVCLYNEGYSWMLAEGQEVNVSLEIKGDGTQSAINVGYICVDNLTGEYQTAILANSLQIVEKYSFDFIAPLDGEYYFFFANFSAGKFQLNFFEVTIFNSPIDFLVAEDEHIIPVLSGKTYVDLTHGGSVEADDNNISVYQLFTNSTEITVSIPNGENGSGTIYLYAIDGENEVNNILEFALDSKNTTKTFTGLTSSRNYYINAVGFDDVRITVSD